jgi:hypothetical protein
MLKVSIFHKKCEHCVYVNELTRPLPLKVKRFRSAKDFGIVGVPKRIPKDEMNAHLLFDHH